MLKSCSYCGRIHDSKHDCGKRPTRKKKDTETYRFHRSRAWTHKSEQIRNRDNHMCQVCVRGLHNPVRMYETEDLSVHHIESVEDNNDRKLDDSNLITLCRRHHEMAEAGVIGKDVLHAIAHEQEERYWSSFGV